MAEIAVEAVLNKLDNAELRKVLRLYNFSDQVDFVMSELRQNRPFLKHADSRGKVGGKVWRWARAVRNVAHKIDDAVNIFRGELNLGRGRESGFLRRRHACNELRKQIDEIRIIFREISEDRNRYGLQELDETSWWRVRSPRLIPPVNNLNVVGFEAHRRSIIELLLAESNFGRSEIIIAGMGGLGKTALAMMVYHSEEVSAHFQCRIWLPVSQENSFIDHLRRMQGSLVIRPNESNEEEEEEYLKAEINRSLREKKYLVVLDDVWTRDLWNALKDVVLPDSNNGRVLMTTRNKDVAVMASPGSILYQLPFLNDEQSKELLLRKALPDYDYSNQDYPVDLMDVTMKFAKKCEGLPLALVVVGDLLSKREHKTVQQWARVLSTMGWHLEGKKCLDILAISFEDLSVTLKSCFLHCACLSEGFNITAKNIIKMWVAEGFIQQDARQTMEDTAEIYLEELAQRCLVQVTKRYSHGAIKSFRIHVLLHELAICKAKSNNFLLKYKDGMPVSHSARRVAFPYEVANEDVFQEIQIPNVRTIVASDVSVPIPRHKLLVVLELSGTKNLKHLPRGLMDMFNLKYLGLRSTGLTDIPETIGNLANLQTLDVKDTFIESLPDSLWGIRSLRHVHVSDCLDHVDGPPPSANLETMFSLKTVRVRKTWQRALPRIPQVRKLGLSCCNIANDPNWVPDWDVVTSLLCRSTNLISLVLRGSSIPATVLDAKTSPSYQNLQSLFLCSSGSPMNLDGIEMPPKLIKLTLQQFVLEQDPMPILGKLSCLKILRLMWLSMRDKMVVSDGGFPKLERLKIMASSGFQNWEVNGAAMPNLNELHVISCPGLKVLPNLQHLTNLREFNLLLPSPELKEKLVQNPTYGVPSGYQLSQFRSAEFRLSAVS